MDQEVRGRKPAFVSPVPDILGFYCALGRLARELGQRSKAAQLLDHGRRGRQHDGAAVALHRLRLLDVLSYPEEVAAPVHKISLKRPDELHKLTERERQILKLIGEGFSTKMIADMLKISINTVETHRRHLLEKLNAKNSMELIRKAFMIFWS